MYTLDALWNTYLTIIVSVNISQLAYFTNKAWNGILTFPSLKYQEFFIYLLLEHRGMNKKNEQSPLKRIL